MIDSREFLNIANAFNCAQQAGCVEEKPKYFEEGKKKLNLSKYNRGNQLGVWQLANVFTDLGLVFLFTKWQLIDSILNIGGIFIVTRNLYS